MILRDYQKECVESCIIALQKHGNTVAVVPTGGGKTVVLSAVIKDILLYTHNYKVLVLAHRNELIAQNREKFLKVYPGASTSIVNGDNKDWSGQVVFGMEQTISRDNNLKLMPKIDLFVIDEAHHAPAPGYVKIIERAKELNPNLLLFGVTATPNRGDKIGLGKIFDNHAYQIGIKKLIASGHLVRPRTYIAESQHTHEQLQRLKTNNLGEYSEQQVADILDTEAINEDVIQYWRKYAHDRKTVVFCSTVLHARHVANSFNEAGVTSAIITGETSQEHREIIFQRMDEGLVQVLVNVAVLTEGWDYPPISCVVLLRMTSFKSTMIQMVGRGLRTIDQREYPNLIKTDCVILDFGISSILHGTLEQQIDLYPKKQEESRELTKKCPECYEIVAINLKECPGCGFEFTGKPKEPIDIYGMSEIEMLKMSQFAWHKIQTNTKNGSNVIALLANGFKVWSCIIKKGEYYLTVCGSNDRANYDIDTQIIYKGDKSVAISKGNDFLYERESEEAAWKSASWRQYPPSEKQMDFIAQRAGEYVLEEQTKGAASAIIAFEINVKKELSKMVKVA